MNVGPNLSKIASIIADPSRGKMLASLMNLDGLPASELAHMAGVTAQTASSHLSKMVAGGLVKLTKQGRHRYYSIASEQVADILEKLAILSPMPAAKTTRDSIELKSLRVGRTCYGHLAGRAGVALLDRLLTKKYLEKNGDDYSITSEGNAFFEQLGLSLESLQNLRRVFACPCLDWTERKYHLAGALGSALTALLFEKGFVRRFENSRAVAFTDNGRVFFLEKFLIDVTKL
ncbi:MAG: ArsR/SmtB family transcription factor [Bdellovibrionales bacterium]